MNWAVGHNNPGYLPEGDVFVTANFELARRMLLDDLKGVGDFLHEVADRRESDGGDQDAALAADEAWAALGAAPSGKSFLVYVDGRGYWIVYAQEIEAITVNLERI